MPSEDCCLCSHLPALSLTKTSPGPPIYFIPSFFCFPQTPVCLPFSVLHIYAIYLWLSGPGRVCRGHGSSAQCGSALCLVWIFRLSLEYGMHCIIEEVCMHCFMQNSCEWLTNSCSTQIHVQKGFGPLSQEANCSADVCKNFQTFVIF